MSLEHREAALRRLTKQSGASFYTRRVFQRWARGEISTDKAVELLLPEGSMLTLLRRDLASRVRWPLLYEVTLKIDPALVASDATVGTVGLRLVRMGGSFVAWKPDLNGRPAEARFEFATPEGRADFLDEALKIPGISLTTPE